MSKELIEKILSATKPLPFPREGRLPLYLWHASDPGAVEERHLEKYLQELDARGTVLLVHLDSNRLDERLKEAVYIGRVQKRLGMATNINASACLNSFFNGDPKTAHIDDSGRPFFDESFVGPQYKMGCPFAVESRIPAIKERVVRFLECYHSAGVPVNFVFVDWEIDGPIEWNGAWENSKRCTRCRKIMGSKIENFYEFQKTLRIIRSRLQKEAFADLVLAYFPKARVGNYAVYPHKGWRCWYDYFEFLPEGAPFIVDQKAKYRPWFHEFPLTGYNIGMPTIYTWYPIFHWYDFKNPDYRWFYNLLLEASNAGESALPIKISLITFVHWHTTAPPPQPDPAVKQFSGEKYQELLWHMLFRGHSTFFLWCQDEEVEDEVRLLHQVYAAALKYRDFLNNGIPVTFETPKEEGTVVSGLRWKERVLIRRTDFAKDTEPFLLHIEGQKLKVPRLEDACQIFNI